jgi:DNA replication and repair protein RecF
MLVTAASLRDFRNYERAQAAIGPALTVVTGDNGTGKTNLLEAVYFGLTARSSRTRNERELVRHGCSVARVSVDAEDVDGRHVFEVGLAPGEEKRCLVDGAPPDDATADRRPPVAVFVPERLELVKGAPAARRAHVDQFIAAVWPARAATRAAYGRALAQRNAMIARIRTGAASPELLDPWDAEVGRSGAELMADRAQAVAELAPRFALRAAELGLPGDSGLRYRPRSSATTADELREELLAKRPEDLERGFSGHGPHRDEMVLEHGGRALRAYGSQGQQRTGLLALIFAERDLLVAAGRPPLLLLDDVMSELDGNRRQRLVETIRSGGQAIVTATEAEHVPGSAASDVAVLDVAGGAVRPVSRLEAA